MCFVILVLVVWLNEMIDISSLWFGGPASEMNVFRGCMLSVVASVVGIVTVGHTYLQQKRIIRGLLTVCAECRKIRVQEEVWEQLDEYISDHSLALISHGICPHCFEKKQEEIARMEPVSRRDKASAG